MLHRHEDPLNKGNLVFSEGVARTFLHALVPIETRRDQDHRGFSRVADHSVRHRSGLVPNNFRRGPVVFCLPMGVSDSGTGPGHGPIGSGPGPVRLIRGTF